MLIYFCIFCLVFNFICYFKNEIIMKANLHYRLSPDMPNTFVQYCSQQVIMSCLMLCNQPTELAGDKICGKMKSLTFNISIMINNYLIYAYYIA